MHPVTAMITGYLLAIIGALVALLAAFMQSAAVAWIAVAMVAAAIILELGFARCPSCKEFLGLRMGDVFRKTELYCRHCGKKTDD